MAIRIAAIIADLEERERKGTERAVASLQMALLRAAKSSLEAFDAGGGDGQTNGQDAGG